MRLKLDRKKPEVPGVESFIFIPEEPIRYKAGQFLHYALHHRPTDDRGSDRWFTVASAPYEGEIMITTRLAEEKGSTFKAALQALEPGDTIEISDIDGDFTVDDPGEKMVFIAGGIGVTPFHSILKEADHNGTKLDAVLLYGNRDENVPYRNELESFAKNNPNLAIHYITSPETINEETIRKFVPDISEPIFYVSGPEPMVDSLGAALKAMGVSENKLKQDWFPGYPAE